MCIYIKHFLDDLLFTPKTFFAPQIPPHLRFLLNSAFYVFVILSGSFVIHSILKKRYTASKYDREKLLPPFIAVISFLLMTIYLYVYNWIDGAWYYTQIPPLSKLILYKSTWLLILLLILCTWGLKRFYKKGYALYFIWMLLVLLINPLITPNSPPLLDILFSISIFGIALALIIALAKEIKNTHDNLSSYIPIVITTLLGETFLFGFYLPLSWDLPPSTCALMFKAYKWILGNEIILLTITYIIISAKRGRQKKIPKVKVSLSCFVYISYILILPLYIYYNYMYSLGADYVLINIIWTVSALLTLMVHFFTFIAPDKAIKPQEKAYIMFIYFISIGLISSYGFLLQNVQW